MASSRVHGVQRILSKLESSVNSGNYYEAHQMYKTLYFRWVKRWKWNVILKTIVLQAYLTYIQHTFCINRNSVTLFRYCNFFEGWGGIRILTCTNLLRYFRYLGQKKYEELLDLLYDGAVLLLKHGQVSSFLSLKHEVCVWVLFTFIHIVFLLFLQLQQTSGADLAILLVDVLLKAEASTSEDQFDKLSR